MENIGLELRIDDEFIEIIKINGETPVLPSILLNFRYGVFGYYDPHNTFITYSFNETFLAEIQIYNKLDISKAFKIVWLKKHRARDVVAVDESLSVRSFFSFDDRNNRFYDFCGDFE